MYTSSQIAAKHISDIFPASINVIPEFDPLITGMSLDSRSIKKQELFVAKIGEKYDGRDFIDAAVANGACVVLSEQSSVSEERFTLHESGCPIYRIENIDMILGDIATSFYESDKNNLKIIGITGTNGKTSVCQYLAQALTELGHRVAVLGTIGNGFLPNLQYSALTTQDVLSLHKLFREFSDQGADFVCMEVSSHSLDQKRVAGIRFSHAVFTNLSQDHLDYHKTMQHYANSKTKLFLIPSVKFAAINLDEYGLKIAENLPEKISFLGLGSDLKITNIVQNISSLRFRFLFQNETLEINNPHLMGEFNVENLSLSFLTLVQLGVDKKIACDLLSQVFPAPGRLQKITISDSLPIVFVDFAHTPDALNKTLKSIAAIAKQNIILVFGCGGDRDRGKRSQMAAVAEKYAHSVIVTSDNPRQESQSQIASDIFSGFSDVYLSRVHREDDRYSAIETAIRIAAKDDVVLIAGKGHENQQIFSDRTVPFSDVSVALQVLKNSLAKECLQ